MLGAVCVCICVRFLEIGFVLDVRCSVQDPFFVQVLRRISAGCSWGGDRELGSFRMIRRLSIGTRRSQIELGSFCVLNTRCRILDACELGLFCGVGGVFFAMGWNRPNESVG
jgi:hypothetical protein